MSSEGEMWGQRSAAATLPSQHPLRRDNRGLPGVALASRLLFLAHAAAAQSIPEPGICESLRAVWCLPETLTTTGLAELNAAPYCMGLPSSANKSPQLACLRHAGTYEMLYNVAPDECTAFIGGRRLYQSQPGRSRKSD